MARRLFTSFAKVATLSAFSIVNHQTAILRPTYFAKCHEDTDETKPVEEFRIVIPDEELEDQEWLLEKEKCSFCKFFLGSPCRNQFTKWSKCVDLAKSKDQDFVKACSVYTKDLMDCSSDNDEYFAKARDQARADGSAEGDDDEDESSLQDETSDNSDSSVGASAANSNASETKS